MLNQVQCVWLICVVAAMALLAVAGTAGAQQLANNIIVQENFSGISQIGSSIGDITQMVFGPDGRLYVSTFTNGIRRFDYNPNGSLTNGTTVWSRPNNSPPGQLNGSLGVAFHEDPLLGAVMYIAPAVSSSFDPTVNRVQSIVRLTNSDGDGTWGETAAGEVNQAIVNNLRVTDLHQVNQLLVDDNTLYVGVGSRTRTGGERSEYGGSSSADDGEFSYTGSINWIRDLTELSNDSSTANVAGFSISDHHLDTQPFTSIDTGKLTVYSTGFRNAFGLAMDRDGQLWATMNQNEDPQKPDELHRSNFQDDHNFPKFNEVSGDWKQNPDALSAGFFQTFKDPVALLGNNASADGLDFTYINDAFAGHVFTVRFSQGDDLLAIDPATGAVRQIATGFSNPIDVLTDPAGNLLVGAFGAGGRIYRVAVTPGVGLSLGDFTNDGEINSTDWITLRDNFNTNMAGLTPLQAYHLGDLNNDFRNDGQDFALFKEAFENRNGLESFTRLFEVPEPRALAMLAVMGALLFLACDRVLHSLAAC